MEQIGILRRRMKKAGVTLKSLSYLADESEQTVCRILNQDLKFQKNQLKIILLDILQI
mgnify:CR=1 FL=1